jgi:transcriptional regulator with GAF, ATPase, and Fis domain
MESELFGHEKGAFSGADTFKHGLFEMAHTGALFLDEIGELEPRMQLKLLRVLDGVPYYSVGGQRKVEVNTRILAATNQNLKEAVRAGRFPQRPDPPREPMPAQQPGLTFRGGAGPAAGVPPGRAISANCGTP